MENVNVILYKKMYMIRKVEETIIEEYSFDQMKTPMHMSKGSESISVSMCSVLNDDDQVFGTHRSHALYLAKTEDIEGFFLEMYGKLNGKGDGKSGSMHISNIDKGYMMSSSIVGGNIAVAVGAAYANKMYNNGKIVEDGHGNSDEDIPF